jgi:cell division septal protein FtsQ
VSGLARRTDHRRRPGRLRRTFTGSRLIGLLLIVAGGAAGNWLLTDAAFDFDPAHVSHGDITWTSAQDVGAAVAAADKAGVNVFRLSIAPVTERLRALATVEWAQVRVALPDGLAVEIVEREPVFVLVLPAAGSRFVVDADGLLLAQVPAGGTLADAAAALPALIDTRSASANLSVGERLESIDVAATLKLAAITPADLASGAAQLRLTLGDDEGFVIATDPPSWQAIFGFYTVSVRPPSIIDRQVQCLRSLLANGEAQVESVYLEPSADRCGTFVSRSE